MHPCAPEVQLLMLKLHSCGVAPGSAQGMKTRLTIQIAKTACSLHDTLPRLPNKPKTKAWFSRGAFAESAKAQTFA